MSTMSPLCSLSRPWNEYISEHKGAMSTKAPSCTEEWGLRWCAGAQRFYLWQIILFLNKLFNLCKNFYAALFHDVASTNWWSFNTLSWILFSKIEHKVSKFFLFALLWNLIKWTKHLCALNRRCGMKRLLFAAPLVSRVYTLLHTRLPVTLGVEHSRAGENGPAVQKYIDHRVITSVLKFGSWNLPLNPFLLFSCLLPSFFLSSIYPPPPSILSLCFPSPPPHINGDPGV